MRFADTIATVWRKSIPLFDRLKGKKQARLMIEQGYNNKGQGKRYLEDLADKIPDLKQYDQRRLFVMTLITEEEGVRSTWVLLPDRTLILCSYFDWDHKPPKATARFMGIDTELIKKHYDHSTGVAIHLNASGKLIKDYTAMDGLL